MPGRTSSRMDSVRDVEDELRVRSGSKPKDAAIGQSWEFKGVRGSVGGSLRRIGRRAFGGRSTSSGPGGQRVIVKASFAVHKTGRGRGALQAHVRYLGRDSASLDGEPGRFYDAEREAVDVRAAVREWEQDRHHFRLIVSPERADLLDREPDGLSGYVREWMTRVERDLGTRLEWAAINHHNTDDLHAHVLIRGKRDDGHDLVIPRQYLSHGLREAAQEIATRRLGPRTAEQIRDAAHKDLSAERYTALDATIERHLDADRRLRLRDAQSLSERSGMPDAGLRRRVAARLAHLESLGLATHDRHGRWTVPVDLKPQLRQLSERGDVIKNLHATLGRVSATVERYRGEQVLAGHVVAIGTHDELRGSQYVLVRDVANQGLHYAPVVNVEALRGLEVGGIVRLSGVDPRRARLDVTIAEIARGNGGVYTAAAYRQQLPAGLAASDATGLLAAYERRLATLERGGMSTRTPAGWSIRDSEALRVGEAARARGGAGFVDVVSARSIQSQVEAQAWTWLDRQAHRAARGQSAALPFDPALAAAAEARRRWMIEQGHAATVDGRYTLRLGAARELRRREWQAVAQEYQRTHGVALRPLPTGADVQGRYRGTLHLHGGPHAIVEGREQPYLVPVSRATDAARGAAVLARVLPDGRGQVVAARRPASRPLERE